MMSKDLILVCKLLSTHGIHGALKFQCFSDIAIIKKHDLFTQNCEKIHLEILKNNDQYGICKINNVNNIESAKLWQNIVLYIQRNDLGNEIFISDVLNFNVLLQDGSYYGIVKDFNNYGSGALLEIETTKKTLRNKNVIELYLFTKENFPDINLINKEILLNFPYND